MLSALDPNIDGVLGVSGQGDKLGGRGPGDRLLDEGHAVVEPVVPEGDFAVGHVLAVAPGNTVERFVPRQPRFSDAEAVVVDQLEDLFFNVSGRASIRGAERIVAGREPDEDRHQDRKEKQASAFPHLSCFKHVLMKEWMSIPSVQKIGRHLNC